MLLLDEETRKLLDQMVESVGKNLIKDELVKRFEFVIIDEIKRFQDIQKNNEDSFIEINKRLDEIQKQQHSISFSTVE